MNAPPPQEPASPEDVPTQPLGMMIDGTSVRPSPAAVRRRLVWISALAVIIAIGAGFAAVLLMALIGLITNLAFYGRVSTALISPAGNHLGLAVLAVPVLGAVVVGLMARYGSAGIRGHGIPEAMEQILTNQSRMPARLTILKPVATAVAIGTGGPFGAEGPIIATGGAIGSVLGQLLKTTAVERKILLAAGAAAGMAATFGSPVSAVLLAIELLLFEFRVRSIVPVALAVAAATGVHIAFTGSAPIFAIPDVMQVNDEALVGYVVLGALVGVASVGVTGVVYWIEDQFERLPIHWMWWPAIGSVAVGVIGFVAPRTLGVGYENITDILSGRIVGWALLMLFVLKFLSWAISLGSGTSGGTLAPLFTIGAGLGAALGTIGAAAMPSLGLDPRVAALVGMAAMFAGSSRAFLTSVVFAFETTRQPLGLLPLLGGCTAAVLISYLMMRDTIMTRKVVRRGIRVIEEYSVDVLEQTYVRDRMRRPVVSRSQEETVGAFLAWVSAGGAGTSHQGFPVNNAAGEIVGVVTLRDVRAAPGHATLGSLVHRPPVVAYDDESLRSAADRMVVTGVGRLPVVGRADPRRVIGMLTRSDLLQAHARRLEEAHRTEQSLDVRRIWAD
ncbi:MAG TPA: chloride channel protein [Gemmatimonadales bacterium]